MTHVYLNENVIKDALKCGVITEREADELKRMLKRNKTRARNRKQERVAS